RSVEAGDEGDVFASRYGAVKRAAETERERHPGVAPDDTAVGRLGAGEEPDQCRLAGSVRPEDSEIVTGLENRADLVEHGLPAGFRAIRFADPVEHDHSGS